MQFTISNPNLRFPRARTRRTRTDAIVLHHLDAHWDVHRTHAFHNSLGWNGIGYNFHVALDGTISTGRGIEFQGAHKVGFNDRAVGIGCEGRFHDHDRVMPDVQFNAIVWLCRYLRQQYGDIRILGHRDYNATACPGQFFPLEELQRLQFRGAQGEAKQEDESMETEKRFQRIEDMPIWARPYIVRLTQELGADGLPILRGNSAGDLDLSEDMIRMLVLMQRMRGE